MPVQVGVDAVPADQLVVRAALHLSRSKLQKWLSVIQSLHLAFFINAQNYRVYWRIQVQADYITDFCHKVWVG